MLPTGNMQAHGELACLCPHEPLGLGEELPAHRVALMVEPVKWDAGGPMVVRVFRPRRTVPASTSSRITSRTRRSTAEPRSTASSAR